MIRKPFDVKHSVSDLKSLKNYILSLEGETKTVMECTGRYHEPILHTLSDACVFVTFDSYSHEQPRKVYHQMSGN